jgi:putative alpha-1,2-mannosidase
MEMDRRSKPEQHKDINGAKISVVAEKIRVSEKVEAAIDQLINMKRHYLTIVLFSISICITRGKEKEINLSSYVDPFIGVDKGGNVFPGVTIPLGMVKLRPDCSDRTWNAGWAPEVDIQRFSHTHVSGTSGGAKYGNILVTPTVGRININDYSSSRSNEKS